MIRRLAIAATLFFLGIAAFSAINYGMIASTEPAVKTDVTSVKPAQVAIVLGARVYDNGTPSPHLVDRLEAARKLYAQKKVRRIIVSGDHGRVGYNEVGAMRDWLISKGVKSNHVFMDHAGFRTLDTMARAKDVFGVKSAVICTHEFHTYRALFLAESRGISVEALVADRRTDPYATKNAIRESIARVVAFGDVNIWGREPRLGGPKIDLNGPARQTW